MVSIGLVALMVVCALVGEYERSAVYGLMLVVMELQDISEALRAKSVE